jgi:hypothetical protein
MVYRSAEYVTSPRLAEISGSQVLRLIRYAGLEYDPAAKEGVLVHMLSCVERHRKIGVTAIAGNHDDADRYIRDLERIIADPASASKLCAS